MSAAATAAGYLYASGRLRGRNAREGEHAETEQKPRSRRPEMRVAVYPPPQPAAASSEPGGRAPRAKPAPKVMYRTRRWKPE